MNFASVTFLFFFLPIIVALYFVMRGRTARNVFLLIASLFFYAWGEGVGPAGGGVDVASPLSPPDEQAAATSDNTNPKHFVQKCVDLDRNL